MLILMPEIIRQLHGTDGYLRGQIRFQAGDPQGPYTIQVLSSTPLEGPEGLHLSVP